MNTVLTYPLSNVFESFLCRLNIREEGGMRQVQKYHTLQASAEGGEAAPRNTAHQSVMMQEVLGALSPRDEDIILDATAGAGGHAEMLLRAFDIGRLIALDADPKAVANVTARLAPFGDRATVVNANFSEIERVLQKLHITSINKALFDLGWNRTQLYDGRGLSFMKDEPLNMSYGVEPASGATARDMVNEWKEETIADIIFGYGEERYARRIAKAIVEAREHQPIETTLQLVDVIGGAVPAAYRRGRLHFATKTFQALRVAVNNELGVLDQGLRGAWNTLAPGGRIAVITFHSIEDRAVKRVFAEWARNKKGVLIAKKPITPTAEEIAHNPSSRSAKLRIIEKTAE